jgi:electron transfer flavoprotein beta subunit
MKILVYLKQVPHQDARLDISPDGTWIQEGNIKFEINSYDTYALEEALKAKDAEGAEVVVVSAGPERVTQALRTALGMGADRAVHIKDSAVDGSDALGCAKALAAVAKAEKPELILTGLMSEDSGFSAMGPMIAELAGIASSTAVISIHREGGRLTIERELEGGNLEVVELSTPCLLAVQTGINQVRYASLKGIMQAKKKTIDVKTAADLGVADHVGSSHAKLKTEKIFVPPKGATAEIVKGTTDEIAAKLASKIKELGVL